MNRNALGALALGMASLMASGEALAGTCRIDWHPRGGGLLSVYKDGRVYKNKAYLSHDDVVRLHDVLISSGECQRDLAREFCSVRQTAGGQFQVHFGAKPLYRREIHKSSGKANRRMRELVRVGFCEAQQLAAPRQHTASKSPTKTRKLKISN